MLYTKYAHIRSSGKEQEEKHNNSWWYTVIATHFLYISLSWYWHPFPALALGLCSTCICWSAQSKTSFAPPTVLILLSVHAPTATVAIRVTSWLSLVIFFATSTISSLHVLSLSMHSFLESERDTVK